MHTVSQVAPAVQQSLSCVQMAWSATQHVPALHVELPEPQHWLSAVQVAPPFWRHVHARAAPPAGSKHCSVAAQQPGPPNAQVALLAVHLQVGQTGWNLFSDKCRRWTSRPADSRRKQSAQRCRLASS